MDDIGGEGGGRERVMLVEPDPGVVLGPHEPGGWVRPCRCTPAAALGKLLCAPLRCGPQQDLQLCSPTPCMALRQPEGVKSRTVHTLDIVRMQVSGAGVAQSPALEVSCTVLCYHTAAQTVSVCTSHSRDHKQLCCRMHDSLIRQGISLTGANSSPIVAAASG